MRKIAKSILKYFGLAVVRNQTEETFRKIDSDSADLLDLMLSSFGCEEKSKSQLKQDIFVLLETGFKQNGFFVEFGATNGVDLSNTYLLEKSFGWNGILAEPAKMWHSDLMTNRSATIELDCVWSISGKKLLFNMVEEGEFSTIADFSKSDLHADKRKTGSYYEVNTISLIDLLNKHNAPNKIDYLSIDTEGSEFEILNSFDFSKYKIDIITCEHNHTINRENIFKLLTEKGYVRKFEGLSKWDDWYLRAHSI